MQPRTQMKWLVLRWLPSWSRRGGSGNDLRDEYKTIGQMSWQNQDTQGRTWNSAKQPRECQRCKMTFGLIFLQKRSQWALSCPYRHSVFQVHFERLNTVSFCNIRGRVSTYQQLWQRWMPRPIAVFISERFVGFWVRFSYTSSDNEVLERVSVELMTAYWPLTVIETHFTQDVYTGKETKNQDTKCYNGKGHTDADHHRALGVISSHNEECKKKEVKERKQRAN